MNFINWASKFFTQVNINMERKVIQSIQDNLEYKSAKEGESEDIWIQFQKYKTIDNYYSFKNSKLFENIFENLEKEMDSKRFEFTSWKPLSDGRKQIELIAFDEVSRVFLFEGLCKTHFSSLISYPGIGMNVEILNKYWLNINARDVTKELQFVSSFTKQEIPI